MRDWLESTADRDSSAEKASRSEGFRDVLSRATERAREIWPRVRPTRRQTLAAVAALALVLSFLWLRCGVRGCPGVDTLAAFQPGGAPVLLDRNGEEFADLAPVGWEVVPLEDLPDHVAHAFLAVEDRRFREHDGVDWLRVGGAALANVKAGGISQGSSTITMQLARNVFPRRLPGSSRTLRRKLLEVRVAMEIEETFSKDEILELYLNHIYFGRGIHGIEGAARQYFGVPASSLSLSQAAVLAALPKAPSHYDPRRDPERARERRNLVLTLMEEQGRVEPGEAEAARAASLGALEERGRPASPEAVAPYFVDAVRRILEQELGEELYASPLRIRTTLDREIQSAAEEALERQLRAIERSALGAFDGPTRASAPASDSVGTGYVQGSIVVVEAATGEVLAVVGGRDYGDSRFNRATRARRQVGSAFKPFVFATALERGFSPTQRIADEPLRMELAGGEVWEPQNFDGRFDGEITLRDALVRSKNVPAVRVASAVGTRRVGSTARRAGLGPEIPREPSMALGTVGATPLELAGAYTAFAGGGQMARPALVTSIEDAEGRTVWARDPGLVDVLDARAAYLITDMLADAVDRGTARSVRSSGFQGPAAGKTGTTDNGYDAWFVGYTPDLVGAVWIGFDRPRTIVRDEGAGTLAAPVWGRMMSRIYRSREMPDDWSPPEGVVELQVDPASGLVLEEGCEPEEGEPATELFIEGEEPATVCPAGREEGPGLLRRVGDWIAGVWRSGADWVAGLFEDEDEEESPSPAAVERALGTQPLPRRGEERAEEEKASEKETEPASWEKKKEARERLEGVIEELEKEIEGMKPPKGRGRGRGAEGRGNEGEGEGQGEGGNEGGGEGGGEGESGSEGEGQGQGGEEGEGEKKDTTAVSGGNRG